MLWFQNYYPPGSDGEEREATKKRDKCVCVFVCVRGTQRNFNFLKR